MIDSKTLLHTGYAVYLCGPTDCFFSAMFLDKEAAEKYGEANNQDGFTIREWNCLEDIDTSEIGWSQSESGLAG